MTCSSDNYIRIFRTSDWVEIFNFKEIYYTITSCSFLNSGEFTYVKNNKKLEIKE